MKIFFLAATFYGLVTPVFTMDFGAAIGGSVTAENNKGISTKATLTPWFSLPLDNADFFVSLGVTAELSQKVLGIPELYRLEFSWRPAASLIIRAGRIPWMDTTHFTAKGNFDGVDLRYDWGTMRFGISVLYTGLLYRETADINASPTDPVDYYAPLDYADFANTYFSPRRVITALYGEFPSLVLERGDLYAGLLAQFDLSGADEAFHTQYFLLRYIHIYKQFDFSAAAALQLENTIASGIKTGYAFALEAGWNMQAPLFIKDRLFMSVRFASGNGPSTAAFFPVVREAQGIALRPGFSGIMIVRANYEARIKPGLSADVGTCYFIRTDSTSFAPNAITDNSYFVGAEIDASVLWVPFSDLSFSFNGGVFFRKPEEPFLPVQNLSGRFTWAPYFPFKGRK